MAVRNSIRTASGEYTNDFTTIESAPGNSILLGCWCRGYVADPTLPVAHDNFDVGIVYGSNWSVVWILDNMNIDTSYIVTRWNSNSMFFANAYLDGSGWAGDYCMYVTYDVQTEAEALGWKWTGCQIILGSSSVTMRQWVKFGLTGTPIKTGEDTVSFADLRLALIANGWTEAAANAWTPSDISGIRWGWGGNGSSSITGDIVYAKAVAMADEPSISTLNTMALNFSADTSLWADWTHDWVDGAPVLSDRSGNGRALSSGGGVLAQGYSFDDGVSEGVTGTVSGPQVVQTGEATGILAFSATGSGSQAVQTGASVAVESFIASSNGSQITQSGEAVAALAYNAMGTGTQAVQGGDAVGVLAFSATVDGQQATQTGDATGIEAFTGTISGEQLRQTGAAEGSVVAEGIVGSVSGTQSIQSGAGMGALEFSIICVGPQVIQIGDAVGVVIGPSVTGTIVGTQAIQAGEATGYIGDIPIIGVVAGTQLTQTGSAEGLEVFTGTIIGEQVRQTGGSAYVPVAPARVYTAAASAEVRQGSVARETRSVRVSA